MRLSFQMWLRNCEPCLHREETIQLSTSCKPWSLPENEFSELWRTFINFSWLLLTLASSLDVEQVRFASWSFTAFCLETTFLISQPFQFFRKSTILHFSSSKVRCSKFSGRLLGSFFAFYFVVLKNFKIDFFNWYFVMPSRSAPAYFNSLKLELMFLSSRLLSIVT